MQAQRVLTQSANGTIQALTPATVQAVAAPQVQQVPVSNCVLFYGEAGGISMVAWQQFHSLLLDTVQAEPVACSSTNLD